ncbi:MAG TPA: bifunctional isocitrate dehydrogenase kinase/phosphatase [Gemmatimonadaceae bacterium]|nr:bifunctional isocitrate dehydrogenase kinase/phosphatase [Gemmatimonadaceae bacterium]
MPGDMIGNAPAVRAAAAIHDAFDAYHGAFRAITRRARQRFEQRDWPLAQRDAAERLAIYKRHLDAVLAVVRDALGDAATDAPTWQEVRWLHSALIVDRDDCELAETFFNSVTRRIFTTVGVNQRVEYVFPDATPGEWLEPPPILRRYAREGSTEAVVRRILGDVPWSVPWRDLGRDAALVAERVREGVCDAWGDDGFDAVEMLESPFFRNKGAYLVGRIWRGDRLIPLLLPLLNDERGIHVDAVLTTSDEASIVFGFSWSYFLADIARPSAAVEFLASIMPLKRTDELYTAIGYNKHGKTELYRSLVEHLRDPAATFEFAPGDEGLVMSVFTLPSLNVVFKIIKDSFGHPKRTTRRDVMAKYHLVFVRDRVGRLADAQEFEHLQFPRARFSDELLRHLVEVAGSTVHADDDRVVIRHLYTERRVTPLNVYLREASPEAARDAIVDYGWAIKDLAAANIFTGDMLLKNFGVSRHGRVIFYDYDELCLLTDCTFRSLPQPRSLDEELSAEPWYYVGELDVFPEEFGAFMVPAGELREAFLGAHADLLTVEFWRAMQERQRAGELSDVFPYRQCRRLPSP